MNTADHLLHVLSEIAGRVSESGSPWVVGGSAGLLLRGLELDKPPRDLDLYADEEDVLAVHSALEPYSVDRQVLNESGLYRSILSHYLIDGIAVELVGGFEVQTADDLYRAEVREVLDPYGQQVSKGQIGFTIVPLAHELCFNVLRAREDRSQLIASAISQEYQRHMPAFQAIKERNRLSEDTLARMQGWIGQHGTEEWTDGR
ncbi:hypothetical protein [Paenibacillus abyssi]|uniref:Uncharacterized protein n=1 Tax=Paenibacillus abyssi TaxID=1340531 RepID=A0A917CIU4_9BACL|nr:hypothetical protein [Paenibacillus abyssi]GGF87869.1 hypothetical protein GCM10010916_01470 [Paenibacillus abyssi]